MAENKQASEGLAEDLIRSMVQTSSIELHLKTLVEKRQSEMDNGLIDTNDFNRVNEQIDVLKNLKEELFEVTEQRRQDMRTLFDLFEGKGDKEQWCIVKHAAMAMYTAFEAWQASDNDRLLYQICIEKNAYFIKKITQFTGVPITECASCFSDMMKGAIDDEG
ncbi:hypothetical protein [Enterococcus sp. C56]|uniref:hypothetical protein n=1 Tax=unclassified Enterococcus TaxID=2608891 RepID=UPI0034A01816